MLSRVANNLFWMDRYMERTNGLLNQIKSNYISNREYDDSKSWKMIFESYFSIEEEHGTQFTNSDEIINYLIFDSNSGKLDWRIARPSLVTKKRLAYSAGLSSS